MNDSPKPALPPVLYEDESLLVLDKPSGLLVAPDRWDKTKVNLMDLVHRIHGSEHANAHRLDKDTSGVFVVARNLDSLRILQAQFDAHTVAKTYLALVRPSPVHETSVIDAPIGPDEYNPGRMRVVNDGRPASTRVTVLERFDLGYAFMQAEPQTGRTHQIRVHLAHLGCPIVGDAFYRGDAGLFLSTIKRGYKPSASAERPLIGRLALHASAIRFRHPLTQTEITISAPLPHDFEVALKYLRRFCLRTPGRR
jgi:RluA family pseudouridine synthase